MEEPHIAAHKHSIRHHAEIAQSRSCGCFYCGEIYPPTDIQEWVKDGATDSEKTALCPRCGIDSVIGEKSGFPISKEFLDLMNRHWF